VSGTTRAVAAWGLPTSLRLPDRPLDDEAFATLLRECEQHRLVGLLGAAARAGAVPLADSQRGLVEQCWQRWLAHALRIERLTLEATACLERAGLEARVLKGVALAHQAYPDPSWRVVGDADLLVRGEQLGVAVDALIVGLGLERDTPELRPGFDARFGKEVLLRSAGNLELDLHRTLVEGALGLTIRLDDLFLAPGHVVIGGRRLPTLGDAARLLHACYAAAFGDWPPRLASLRDVSQLLGTPDGPPTAEVLAMARAWRSEAVVALAVTEARDAFAAAPDDSLTRWAAAWRSSRLDRLLVAAQRGPARASTRHLAALLVVPGVEPRLAYLRAVAFPQREYLAWRGLSIRDHATRALRRLGTRGG
jgi:hypothetical protein